MRGRAGTGGCGFEWIGQDFRSKGGLPSPTAYVRTAVVVMKSGFTDEAGWPSGGRAKRVLS
jgi:hypothetical protein